MDSASRELRLLAVVPHPDDEVYLMGGTLALAAHFGARVSVAFCTRGEAGVDRSGECKAGPALAEKRTAEACAASKALGLDKPHFLDLGADGALSVEKEESALGRLGRFLDEQNPQVVISLARNGVYGHRDHICCTRWLEQVMASRAESARLLLADAPRGLFIPVWRVLRTRPQFVEPDLDPEELGIQQTQADLPIDISRHNETKLRAMACHESQLTDKNPMTFLLPGLLEPLLNRELFSLASGPPLPRGAHDPFVGLP